MTTREAKAAADPVLAVQRLYPQVFLACHARHVRRNTTPFGLTEQESSLLAHLDTRAGMRPRDLAAHLGVAPSTLSAALARLQRLGCIARDPSALDGRAAELRLTPRGIEAMQATSVLDRARLAAALARLTARERAQSVAGLALLARACNRLMVEEGSAR
jgi:DNA-binding MarR family transcriptional regulator